jgi:hypothetical protein
VSKTTRWFAIGSFALLATLLPNCGQETAPAPGNQIPPTLEGETLPRVTVREPDGDRSNAAEFENTPDEPSQAVVIIENAVTLAPGFVTISGFAGQTTETQPIEVTAWVDGVAAGSALAIDRHLSETGDVGHSGFVIDLAVAEGTHLACIAPSMRGPDEGDCIDVEVEPVDIEVDDVGIVLTGVTPDPTGVVDVRGVIAGSMEQGIAAITVSTDVGVVTAHGADEPVTRLEVNERTFRLELQDLQDGAYLICPGLSGLTVAARGATPDTTQACGTVIVGAISIGTTGRPVLIEPVSPPADHPLHEIQRDAGISVPLIDGSTLWLFGDSSEWTTDGRMRYFVNNTAAWASADAPTVTRDGVLPNDRPALFAEPPPGICDASEFWKAALWPESAVAIPQDDGTDRVVVFMSKVCLGSEWLDIDNVGFALAEYRYDPADPPIDRPIRGVITQPDLWPSSVGYGRALLHGPDGSLYGYWCGEFPDNWTSCSVARVAPETEADPIAWSFWNGGDWTDADAWTSVESDAVAMELPGSQQYPLPIAAFGVTYADDFDAYLMVYSPWPGFSRRAAVRASETPVGPWTESIDISLPGCVGEVSGLEVHCYAVTPQTQLCDEGMFAGGYFDLACDDGRARYFTFEVPFVVTQRES